MSARELALLEESEVESTLGWRLLELLEAGSESEDLTAPAGRRPSGSRLLELCRILLRWTAAIRSDRLLARFSGSLRPAAEAAGRIRANLSLGASNVRPERARARSERIARGNRAAGSRLAAQLKRVPAVLDSALAQLAYGVTRSGRRRAEFARERRARELQRRMETDLAHTARKDKDEFEAAGEWQRFSPVGERVDAGAPPSAGETGWIADDECSTLSGDGAVLTAEGHCDFFGLTSLVASRAAEFPEAIEEWHAYLHNLKPHVDSEGYLSPELSGLIASVFTPLLESPARSA